MPYTMADLERASGLSSRTLRDYIRLKLLEPPSGHGPGATYTEEQLLSAVCIARMRARKTSWTDIAGTVPRWSLRQLRAYVKKTDPPKPPAAPPSAPPPSPFEPPVLEGEPAGPPRQLPGSGDLPAAPDEPPLPGGPRWALVPLLPGMVLMVRQDAASVVRRAASEIIDRYGVRDG
jgi:hypothetical protein